MACLATAVLRAAERPNILWITAEDLSPLLGCYGHTYARTPQLDASAMYLRFCLESAFPR